MVDTQQLKDDLAKYKNCALIAISTNELNDLIEELERLRLYKHLLEVRFGTLQEPQAPAREQSIEERFQSLKRQWKRETSFISSTTVLCSHPAYQAIIEMGGPVVPLLLNELRTAPDHWFAALKAITGVDPVKDKDRGNLEAMTKAWLEWADNKSVVSTPQGKESEPCHP